MVVGYHQCNAANLNQSKAQFQLELSLAQFSSSLSLLITEQVLSEYLLYIPFLQGFKISQSKPLSLTIN